ncbi:dipeptidase [Liquorilactobacillus aquaticus DSM 21051]|uniref:Dipeptidase n=1 Tax=Liquorilactobacillus aquaticus DSM 21051 TaxID=1423725 RepID=A0A0R2D645_9LACO|nr:Sapep family Mn(2+)-dependent dipeptidase [Liquorilactobacillus aquaticus]KRM95395.1 dipeptidase [Liquorilactobacillus aquaticus DSM 21051]
MKVEELKNKIKKNMPIYQESLAKIIRIPSIKGEPAKGAPFGKQPREALQQALVIAHKLGLKTKQLDDQVGWAELTGKNDNYVAALGHLDVVAAPKQGWKTSPFDLTIKKDYMYGRGVLDNKGPIMGALFALALLKEDGFRPEQSIRIIFGTDEESGSSDMKTYNLVEDPPLAGFTPDGKYPVVYAERGMLRMSLIADISDSSDKVLSKIEGAFSPSYIPDKVIVKFLSGEVKTYLGEKSPSNAPDLGKNALLEMARDQRNLPGQLGAIMEWLYRATKDSKGKGLKIAFTGEKSGELQCSVYGIALADKQLKINFSIRYPIELTKEKLLKQLKTQLPNNGRLTINQEFAPLYYNPEAPGIKVMQQIYENVTGLEGTPVTTTGITYARFLPNIVAFGPSFPGQRGIAHKENEWLKVSDWEKIIAIEYLTLKKLAEREYKL